MVAFHTVWVKTVDVSGTPRVGQQAQWYRNGPPEMVTVTALTTGPKAGNNSVTFVDNDGKEWTMRMVPRVRGA